MRRLQGTLGLAALVLAGTGIGCNPYSGLCDAEMACRGGNAADYDACIIRYEMREELADVNGCQDLWDRYLACAEDELRCSGNRNWTHDGTCNNQWSDYNRCVD